MLLNLGGVIATLGFSVLALRTSSRLLTACSFVGVGIAFVAMSLVLGNLAWTLLVAVVIGIMLNASAAGLYVLAPDLYPASVRSTAVGWAAAFGRIGAIASPILVGVLLDGSWTPAAVFALFALPTVLAAAAVLLVTRLDSRVPQQLMLAVATSTR